MFTCFATYIFFIDFFMISFWVISLRLDFRRHFLLCISSLTSRHKPFQMYYGNLNFEPDAFRCIFCHGRIVSDQMHLRFHVLFITHAPPMRSYPRIATWKNVHHHYYGRVRLVPGEQRSGRYYSGKTQYNLLQWCQKSARLHWFRPNTIFSVMTLVRAIFKILFR